MHLANSTIVGKSETYFNFWFAMYAFGKTSRTANYLGFALYDLLGREVYNFAEYAQIFTKGKHQVRLDISNNNLNSGLYLLQVSGEQGGASIKLIKE